MTSGSGDPPIDLRWPQGRNAGILHLCDTVHADADHYCHDDTMRDNKLWLLNLAYKKSQAAARLYYLEHPENFRGDPPAYFQQPPRDPSASTHRAAPWPYTYEYTRDAVAFWVDFADMFLGGGVFGNGFLQEEVMCCEIPELANAAGLRWLDDQHKYTLYIRDQAGWPFPLALRDALRTVSIPEEMKRGDAVTKGKIAPSDASKYVIGQPYRVNVLAMATSKLPSPEVAKQKALPVVWDLFNTFVAAFTLARERTDASTKTRINSGPIGTGDFNNNVYLVYILQVLAARFVGISELVLFGYGTDKEPKEETAENLLRELDRILGTKTVSDLLSMIPQLDIPANPPRPRVL